MIGTKVIFVVLISTLNFCNIAPPTGIPRVPRLVRYHKQHGHNPVPAWTEVSSVDVYSRAAMANALEGYMAAIKAFPCCTPLRSKDFELCSDPWLPVNRSVPGVPLIGSSPGNLTEILAPRPLSTPPLSCQNRERPSPNTIRAIWPIGSSHTNLSANHQVSSLRSVQNDSNTALTAWHLDDGNTSATLAISKQTPCSINANETMPQGRCSRNGTKNYKDESTRPYPSSNNQSTLNGFAVRKPYVRSRFTKTNDRLQKIRRSIEEHHSESELYIPLLGRKIPIHRATKDRKPTQPLRIRPARVPVEPFVPVSLATVDAHPVAFSITDPRPLLITFPDRQSSTASLCSDVIQATLSFPLRSVLCMSMVVESALGLLILAFSSVRRTPTGGKPTDEPRTVAMLEGHVVDSFPSGKLNSESCLVVNLSPTNSEQSLSGDDWELPLI